MGISCIILLTVFYVDNGPHLPLWRSLPSIAYWVGPSLVGMPIVVYALIRRHERRCRFAPTVSGRKAEKVR